MINKSKHLLWCEKYRPTTLDDYVFHNEAHKKAFTQMAKDKTFLRILRYRMNSRISERMIHARQN